MDGPESGDELVAAFASWAAGERASAAVADRTRERSLREQASAGATWIGVLVDLAEQRAQVAIAAGNQRRNGRIVGVGRDFCVMRQTTGRPAIVVVAAISAVLPERPGTGPPIDGRESALDMSAVGAFQALSEERVTVTLVLAAGHQVDGELVGVGEDVLTLRTEPPSRRLLYVPVGAVVLCEIR